MTAASAAARTALFPRLRAAADLLMMPKEALTDAAIRAEMLPGMGLARVVRLLQRFTPDDFAQEPLPAGARPSAPIPRPGAAARPRGEQKPRWA